ncbi:DUF4416 family protein [Chlamydiota bacterium]
MGTQTNPVRAKLICALLATNTDYLLQAKKQLVKIFGSIESESALIPFHFTEYYCDEMGNEILRQYISFSYLMNQEDIHIIKIKTNLLERNEFSVEFKRHVNLDPGFITLDKLVLATTKPATYRIYLGKGIYAQSTLYFQNGSFHPWEWTYPDYRYHKTIDFFNSVRNYFKVQLNQRPEINHTKEIVR